MKRHLRRKGFSLLEVLVAVALAAVGFLTIFELFPIGFQAGAKAQARSIAVGLAGELLGRFRRELSQGYPSTSWYSFYPANAGNIATLYDDGTAFKQCAPSVASTPDPDTTYTTGDPSGYRIGADQPTSSQYYWRAEIYEVIDPLQKALPVSGDQSAITVLRSPSNTQTRWFKESLISMRRVTVYVMGPFPYSASANEALVNQGPLNGKQRNYAVEVRMATYVAKVNLGDSFLTSDLAPTPQGAVASPILVPVDSVQGFWAYAGGSRLSTNEILDTGPAFTGLTTQGQDYLGLDNVWIGDDPQSQNSTTVTTGESNKVIGIIADFHNSTSAPTYQLQLLKPIRGYKIDGDPLTPFTSYSVGTHVRSKMTLHYF